MNKKIFVSVFVAIAATGLLLYSLIKDDSLDQSASDNAPRTLTSDSSITTNSSQVEVSKAIPVLDEKPPLEDLDGWLQSDIDSIADLEGQVVIVQFWTFGCQDCKNALPGLQEVYSKWKPQGVEIVGIHTPEFEYEKDPSSIASAAEELGVVWPIALDTDRTNFRAWQENRRFWPRTYILDKQGKVRYDKIGSGAVYKPEFEETIATLLSE